MDDRGWIPNPRYGQGRDKGPTPSLHPQPPHHPVPRILGRGYDCLPVCLYVCGLTSCTLYLAHTNVTTHIYPVEEREMDRGGGNQHTKRRKNSWGPSSRRKSQPTLEPGRWRTPWTERERTPQGRERVHEPQVTTYKEEGLYPVCGVPCTRRGIRIEYPEKYSSTPHLRPLPLARLRLRLNPPISCHEDRWVGDDSW